MPNPDFDLLITAERVFCTATGREGSGAVAVREGRIAAAGSVVRGTAGTELSFPGAVLLPGLIDLHAHPDRGASKYGVDPDDHLLARGTTTVMSQGDAGAENWGRYRQRVVEPARTRVRMALNLGRSGEATDGGCLAELTPADVAACVEAVGNGGKAIWGISVNTSRNACRGTDPRVAMRLAVQAAELCGKPLLVGTRKHDDYPLAEQLELLRAGDVVTYCFHPDPEGMLEGGRVRPEVWRARERGVLFDVGHGMTSFSFAVAERCLAEGFPPDTISTDFYERHVGSNPPHDLPRVISKLIAAGMPERDAFAAATRTPARVLGLEGEIGTLAPGACADLAVLRWNAEAAPLTDVLGETRVGGCWEPVQTIRGGTPNS